MPKSMLDVYKNMDFFDTRMYWRINGIDENHLKTLEKILRSREFIVIKMRFIQHKTLREIGEYLGVTKERIRQMEHKSIRKIIRYSRVFNTVDTYNYNPYFSITPKARNCCFNCMNYNGDNCVLDAVREINKVINKGKNMDMKTFCDVKSTNCVNFIYKRIIEKV